MKPDIYFYDKFLNGDKSYGSCYMKFEKVGTYF